MALTNTYKSSARTFSYKTPTNQASPMIAYKVTATRSSISSKSVTLKLDFSVGWSNNKKGSLLKDPFKMKVEVGSTTLAVSVNIPKCNGAAGKLYDKNNTTAYSIATETVSKTITWTSGNALDITGTCSQAYIGETQKFSGGSISMPDYSSSSGGGGGGSTTINANSVSLSIPSTNISLGSSATLKINSTIGTGNGISEYKIYEGSNELTTIKFSTTKFDYTVTPNSTGTKTYKVTAVSTKGSSYNKTSSTVNLTVSSPSVNPISYLYVGSVDGSDPNPQQVYVSVTKSSKYWAYSVGSSSGIKTVVDSGNDVSYITAKANQTIYVFGCEKIGNEYYYSTTAKSGTVGIIYYVTNVSSTITPKIIKNNISSPDLVTLIQRGQASAQTGGGSLSYTWEYAQSSTPSGLSKPTWLDLGVIGPSFTNLDMTQKVNKGYYYKIRVIATNSYNKSNSSESEIYQIPKPPGLANFTKIITKSNPYNGYNEIIKDNKKYYGSGLFLQWNNPTITDSQVDFDIIEIIYQSKSSTATEYNSIQTAQFQYHKLLDNEIEYEYSNNVPYTVIKPSGASGSGGGADLDVDSLYETRIGIRITDILGQYTDTWYTAETFIKAQAPDFGGNLTLNISEFRPFTCNIDGKMHFTSSVARSAAQDKLFYFIDCYVNERRATIKILDSIPISTLEMDTQSTGYILYQDDNIIVKKENGTTIAYEVNNGYFKNKLLAETKLKSSKEDENIYFNDDFNEVVYQIYVKDDFDASTRHYSTENKSIKFIEAPTLNNNNYLSIGINRYNKSLNPFNDNSIILINSSSSNSERIVNPGEDIIFRFKQAKDYNGADYNSTMRGDVKNYNVYVSRNDSIVTTDYDKLNYTLLKTFSIDELKKALPSNSNDEYYYFSYNIKNYNESKFVTFKIEAVDSKYKVSEPIYSDTYLVPCRAVPMDFYLSNVRLEKNIDEKYYIQFKAKLNDFGGSTFINDTYGYSKPLEQFSYPNYERQFSVNSNDFSTKGYIIFEGCLDGDFSNKGTTTIIKDMGNGETQSYTYNNYFSEKITISLGDKHYTDKIEQLYDTKLLSDEWTNGIKNNILGKIFFKATFKISYGFLNLEETEDNFDLRYLVVTSVSAPYSYYQDAPTVSYRNHQVGINTKDFGVDSEGGQKEVLIVQDNGSYNLVVFKGAEQKIVLNLTERTLSATTENNGEIIINFNNGTIDGAIIKSAEW